MHTAARWLLALTLLLPTLLTQAGTMAGYVYTRALVTNESGNLTWGEYDPETGQYLSDLAEATGDWDPAQWRVMSGDEFRGYVSQYESLTQQYDDLEPPLSREEYETQDLLLADGQTPASKPDLRSGTAYVAVLPQSRRLIDDPQSLVLAEFPVDLSEPGAVTENTLSLLVQYDGSGRGAIKATTGNRIGFKAAFLKDKDGNPIPVPENSYSGEGFQLKRWEQSVLGPISGARIESPMMTQSATDSEGFYSVQWYSVPCPLIGYTHDAYMTAWLRYQRFNPKAGGRGGPYLLMRPMVENCTPNVFIVPFIGPFPLGLGEVSTYPLNTHFPVDVMVVSGTAQLSDGAGGQIAIADSTQFQAESPDNSRTTTDGYDFDDDGTPDSIQSGYFDTNDEGEKIFTLGEAENPDQQLQGVWFSSGDKTPGQDLPDLTRAMDSASFTELEHRGLLAQISAEDLRNTDIYVVRVADGKLIAERIGLSEYEADRISDFGEDEDNSRFFYTMQMRNSYGDTFRWSQGGFRAVGRDFDKWQSESGINPDLHQRQADHLQPGDAIRLYAINRATGYIGHTDTVMQQAGSDAGNGGGDLSFHIDPIVMGPPNLKVRVERDYEIQAGLEKGEIREDQIIGFEGASLTSDTAVKITTQWLDHQGRPMPEALQGAGYTGRIAILSGDKTLPNDNQGVYQFAIEPGQHLQVIQLPNNVASDSQHYYLHINGEPESGNPIFQGTDNERTREADFTSSGQNPGILEKRPNQFVPFLVPIYDEQTTELQRQAYRQIQRDDPDLAETLEKPEPVYRWVYRPEMQFSSYQLQMEEIKLSQDENGDGEIQEGEGIDLLPQEKPVITSGGILEIIYGLTTTDLLPLDYFNAGESKELIFALGEQEIKATLGEDQTLQFEDLSQLASLDPDDLLTLRLYANNDLGNVLWEWAFGDFALFPERDDSEGPEANTIRVTADTAADGPEYLAAFFGLPEDDRRSVRWEVEGDGSISPATETGISGQFSAALTLPTQAGSSAIVSAYANENGSQSVQSPNYLVVPGIASQIDVSQSGWTTIGGFERIELSFEVRDGYGNLVEDGTQLSVTAEDLEIIGDPVTENGIAKVEVAGRLLSGDLPVSVTVGEVSETVDVAVHDIELSLDAPAEVPIDTSASFRVTASSSAPSLEGIILNLSVHRGKLSANQVTLDETGTAEVTYASGPYRGFAQRSVKVAGTDMVLTESFSVIEPGDFLVSNVLVVDGAGSVDLQDGRAIAYSNQTELVVHTQPGAMVTPSLFDPLAPPVYALQDYSADTLRIYDPSSSSNPIPDMSSGIDATANDVMLTDTRNGPTSRSWRFHSASRIDVPEHVRTENLEQAGIVMRIKLPDTGYSDSSIVHWDDFGLQLSVNTDGTLTLAANQIGSITSTGQLLPGQWHEVAFHYFNGKLYLAIDGSVETMNSAGQSPEAFDDGNYALRIQAPTVDGLEVASFKVYDWDGEKSIVFGNGTMETSAVADASGVARVPIQAVAPVVAYTRPYYQPSKAERDYYYALIHQPFLPRAYAIPGVPEDCESKFDPVAPDVPDPLIAEAERFLTVMIECLVKPKVTEARVNYETSEGYFKKGVALVKLNLYEGVYATLNQQKDNAIMVANCLDAAVTGSNTSAAGITCDIITSFFLIGDIRDILIQSWHYYVGDQNKYDQLTHALASVGAIGSLVTLAGGTGAPVNILAASGKVVAKFLKLVGPAGIKAGKLLGAKLARIVDDSQLSRSEKVAELIKYVPLIEIGASLTLVFNSQPQLFRFMVELLSIPRALDNAVVWVGRYVERYEVELLAQYRGYYRSTPAWSRPLLPELGYAASSDVITRFTQSLGKLLAKMDGLPTDRMALQVDEALDVLVKKADDIEANIGQADDFLILNAFVVAQRAAGPDAAKAITNMRILPNSLVNAGFDSRAKFVEAIGLLPVKKFEDVLTPVEFSQFQRQLGDIFNKIGKVAPEDASAGSIAALDRQAAGAMGQLLGAIERTLGDSAGQLSTRAFEVPYVVNKAEGSGILGTHVADEVLTSGKYIESKLWRADYLEKGLQRALLRTASKGSGDADKPGQLLLDIVDYVNTGKFNFRWEMGGDLARQGVTEDKIANTVVGIIRNNNEVRREVARAAGYAIRSGEEEGFLRFLEPALSGELFRVIDYNRILLSLGG